MSRTWAGKKKREGGEDKREAEGGEEGSQVSHDKDSTYRLSRM